LNLFEQRQPRTGGWASTPKATAPLDPLEHYTVSFARIDGAGDM
jgi:hypothetical protein